jgi:hypothetical protein
MIKLLVARVLHLARTFWQSLRGKFVIRPGCMPPAQSTGAHVSEQQCCHTL